MRIKPDRVLADACVNLLPRPDSRVGGNRMYTIVDDRHVCRIDPLPN